MSKNYLWFMPSLITAENPSELLYRPYDMPETDETYDGENDGIKVAYKGLQTNIGATKYVVCSLKKENEKLTKIIMLCSEKVLNENLNNNVIFPDDGTKLTTYGYYTKNISKWLSDNGYSDEEIKDIFVKIPLENINPGAWQEMSEPLKEVKKLFGIETNKSSSEKGNLYIDYTGGARSASMLIVFFARMLQRDGMTVKKVLYSNIIRGQKINYIEDCMDTYNLFNLLEAQTEAKFGRTDKAKQYAKKKKNTKLIQMTEDTDLAAKKNRAKQFDSLSQQDKKTFPLTDDMSTEDQAVANVLNEAKSGFGVENALKKSIAQGDSSDSAQIIRENIFALLLEKKLLSWRAIDIKKQKDRETTFFAYIAYYVSYINFVKKLIEYLNSNVGKDETDFLKSYNNFIDENTKLTESHKEYTNVNHFTESEFNEINAELVTKQKKLLTSELKALCNAGSQNIELILNAIVDYTSKMRKYMYTYYSTGFPFANRYGKRTYTKCGYKRKNGKKKTQWINKIYLKRLNAAINKLAEMTVDERRNMLDLMMKDERELLGYFSPACVDTLFILNGVNFEEFAPIMISINKIRLLRNKVIHYKNQGEKLQEIDILANQIMSWIDSHTK